ncbi:putative mediator complex subunit 15, KIX domain-containing protein [Helianthus anomalus]
MDPSNAQVASGAVGDPTTELGDWRAQLAADSRERIKYKILDTLKRHLPYSRDEGLEELKKIASDYLRKISLKTLTTETRSQNPMSDPMKSNSAANAQIQVFYNTLSFNVIRLILINMIFAGI